MEWRDHKETLQSVTPKKSIYIVNFNNTLQNKIQLIESENGRDN